MRAALPLFHAALVWLLLSPLAALGAEETVCIQCHSGQSGALAAAVSAWHDSVHSANGIACHDCHGGDPTDFANAMSPARGFLGVPEYAAVPEFCGRCHVGVLADYRASAHGRRVAAGGAQCVVCHGHHDVREAHLELINERDCSRCHDYGRAAQIKTALGETDAHFAAMERELARLKQLGVNSEGLKGTWFDLRNRFHRVFHSVEVEKVRAETGSIRAELDQIQGRIDAYDADFSRRKLWGGVAVGLLVLLGLVLLQLRGTYAEEEQRD